MKLPLLHREPHIKIGAAKDIVLKARTALADLERISWGELDGASPTDLRRLRDDVEELRLEPDMHRIREVLALQKCADGVELPDELLADAVRLSREAMPTAKLGLTESSSNEELRAAALAGAQRWNAFKSDARLDQAAIADVYKTITLKLAPGRVETGMSPYWARRHLRRWTTRSTAS